MSYDQTHILQIGNVSARLRGDVNPVEHVAGPFLRAQPTGDLVPHLLGILAEPLGVVIGRLGHRRLRVEPVMPLLLVEIGGPLGQQLEGTAEIAQRVAGNRGTEPQVLLVQSPVGTPDTRSRTHENRARQPLGDEPLPQARALQVDALGHGTGSVNVGINDRFPLILQVLGQIGVHRRRVQRHITGKNER